MTVSSKESAIEHLAQFEAHYGYNADYVREILESGEEGIVAYERMFGLSQFPSDLPPALSASVKLVAAMHEDCGPCVQLGVKFAEEADVSAQDIKAVLAGDTGRMSAEALLGYRYAKAVIARDLEADTYRDDITARYGRKAVIALSFAIIAARSFPTLRYAMGYGQSCARVMVGGEAATVQH